MDPNMYAPPGQPQMQPVSPYGGNPSGYGKKSMNFLAIPLVIACLLLVFALLFGLWAFNGRKELQTDVDGKISRAVAAAKQETVSAKEAEFAERVKSPLRVYSGPQAYGSVTVKYPASWSAYVVDDSTGSPYVDGYFYPRTVPNTSGDKTAFALRLQVVGDSYNSVLERLSSNVKQGKAKITPYKAPQVKNVIGSKVTGQIDSNRSGTMVMFQLRDKTLMLWTEAPQFQKDFDKYVLPNFTFLP